MIKIVEVIAQTIHNQVKIKKHGLRRGFTVGYTLFQECLYLNYKTKLSDNITTVEMTGRFTFGDHSSFRKLIEEVRDHDSTTMVLDIAGVEFIDSAGLGMLLLARDEGEKSSTTVVLRGAQGQVKRMLEVARFDTLFKLED